MQFENHLKPPYGIAQNTTKHLYKSNGTSLHQSHSKDVRNALGNNIHPLTSTAAQIGHRHLCIFFTKSHSLSSAGHRLRHRHCHCIQCCIAEPFFSLLPRFSIPPSTSHFDQQHFAGRCQSLDLWWEKFVVEVSCFCM